MTYFNTTNYIQIDGNDGANLLVDKTLAELSPTIRDRIRDSTLSNHMKQPIVSFPEFPSSVVEVIVEFLHYQRQHTNVSSHVPPFHFEPEQAL
ncbi:MAG: hypothetical protein Q8P67_28665, partial [archaeon]|nr:hypothetical protein [archaeon]